MSDGIRMWSCLAVRAWRMAAPLQPWGPLHWACSWPPTIFPPLLCIPPNNDIIVIIITRLVTVALSSSILTHRPFAARFDAALFLLLTRCRRRRFRRPFP
jgi:hypothetical protein